MSKTLIWSAWGGPSVALACWIWERNLPLAHNREGVLGLTSASESMHTKTTLCPEVSGNRCTRMGRGGNIDWNSEVGSPHQKRREPGQ